MVVADDTNHGQVRKRPRLSLKGKSKNAPCASSTATVDNTQGYQGSTPQGVADRSDDATGVQSLDAQTTEDLADQFESAVPSDVPTVPPVASLENLGNTCFLNSVLQILRYTPGFLAGLGELHREIVILTKQRASSADGESERKTTLSMELVKQLFKLYKGMQKREERYCKIVSADVTCMAVKPDRVLDIIREFNPMFEGNLQHDAQELLRCLLCYLEDAERELHQAQSDLIASLPISRLPQSPINPIMQRFLSAGKRRRPSATVSRAPVDEGTGSPTKDSVRTDLFKQEFTDEVDGTAVNNRRDEFNEFESNMCELSADGPDGEVSELSSKHKYSCPNSSAEKCKSSPKKNSFCNGISDLVSNIVQCPVDLMHSDRKRSRNRRSRDDVLKESSDQKVTAKKRTRKKTNENSCSSKEDGISKRMRSDVASSSHDRDKSQPSIQSMFSKSTCRLGIRGRVVRKEVKSEDTKLKAEEKCSALGNSDSDVNDDEVSFPKLRSAKAESPSKLSGDFSKMACKSPVRSEKSGGKLTRSPFKTENVTSSAASPGKSTDQNGLDATQPMLKLEKCDHVCNSPLKSVKAAIAMTILSPAKRKVNFDISDGSCDVDDSDSDEYIGQFKSVPVKPLTVKVEKCDSVCSSPMKSVSAHLAMKYLSGSKMAKINFVEKLFQGTMMLRTRCLECEFFRERKEEFQDVSVPLKREQESSDDEDNDDSDDDDSCLSKLMSAFTEVERLRDDNKYFCDLCRCYVEAERSLHYDRLPDVLTLHLKRFSASSRSYGYVSKINDHVTIPLSLPCLRYKCPKPCSRPDHRYSLYGLVTHAGVTISSGHYLSYVRVDAGPENASSILPLANFIKSDWSPSPKKGDNSDTSSDGDGLSTVQWFECDDESIRIHSDRSFRRCLKSQNSCLLGTPYVLFYQRVNLK